MIPHVILLLGLLCVDLNVVGGSVFSDVVSIETVCDVDFVTCPNGGHAFRDRNHDCAFTPCEFIAPGSTTPPPIAIDPSTRNATWWFGNEEFYIPAIRFREFKRGRRVFKRMTRLMQRKIDDSLAWIQEGSFASVVDIYLISPEQKVRTQRSFNHSTNSRESFDMLLSKQLLTVLNKPWSLYALFGRLELETSEWAVQTAVNVLHEALNLSYHQDLNISNAPADNRTQQNTFPTLVLESDVNVSASSSTSWPQLSVGAQSGLYIFLESLVIRFGLGHVPIYNQADPVPQNDTLPFNRSIIVSSGSEQRSTVSVAVYLTSMPELLHADDVADPVDTVWNFTTYSCDSVVLKSLGAQKNVTYQPLVNASVDSTAHTRSQWNISSHALEANATFSYACSCWMYHHVRDATALTAQQLIFCR